eukprot:g9800.t1
MAVMLVTLALYVMLFLYCIYLLRKDFFSKKRLIDKLDDITLLVCILLVASLFRGIVVVVKTTAYESNASFVVEALSEVFQVSSAFYFVYFGRQLTTKVIREKTMVIRILGRIKRIIVVIIVLLFVRMAFRILRLEAASTVIRVIFTGIYAFIFACAVKMILHSQSVMSKVKQEDEVIALIRFVNRIIIGVFVVFFLWAMAYMIRNYFVKSRYLADNGNLMKVLDPKAWYITNVPSEMLEYITYFLLVLGIGIVKDRPNKKKRSARAISKIGSKTLPRMRRASTAKRWAQTPRQNTSNSIMLSDNVDAIEMPNVNIMKAKDMKQEEFLKTIPLFSHLKKGQFEDLNKFLTLK